MTLDTNLSPLLKVHQKRFCLRRKYEDQKENFIYISSRERNRKSNVAVSKTMYELKLIFI